MDYTYLKPIPNKGAVIAYTGTATVNSANSVAPSNAIAVYVVTSTAAWVCVDRNKTTATAIDLPLAAGLPIVIRCEPGDNISAVQQASGGNLTYCWMC